MNNLLDRLYYNPKTGFTSAQGLYDRAKQVDKSISLAKVKKWYSEQIELQRLTKQANKFDQYKISSYSPNSWQMDLAFWSPAIILTAVNINSRIGYAQILSNKKANTVLNALKKFVKLHKPDIITTDNGSEFMNDKVQAFFKSSKIEHFNNEAGEHNTMGKIERFNRTIKERLLKMKTQASFDVSQKLLSDTIDNYNSTYHTGLKAIPNEMKGRVIESELDHNKTLNHNVESHFNIGDNAIPKIARKTFQKGPQQWSKTVYEITGYDGYKIELTSKNNQVVYVNPNDVKIVKSKATESSEDKNKIWSVESILDHEKMKNGKFKYLVKWKGYEEPTWEGQANLRLVNKNKQSELERKYFDSL